MRSRRGLHVAVSGQGRPLLLVHGVAGSNLIWDPVVEYFEPHFTVVRPDLLGYGHSPKPRIDYTPLVHVEALRQVLTEMSLTPPYVLVGLSMGVNLVLEYARRWPEEVEQLVGIGFPYYPGPAQARRGVAQLVWTRLAVESPRLAALITPPTWLLGRSLPGLTGVFSKIYTPAMARDALRVSYHAFRSSLLNCMVENRLDPLLEASGDMHRLFVHGADDKWCSADEVSQVLSRFEKSKLVVVPDGEHNLVVTKPEVTAKTVLDYLLARSVQEASSS